MFPPSARKLLQRHVDQASYPLVFATISGAHLYGFHSEDSDYDLRGVHVLPAREVLGLTGSQETIERSGDHDGIELDLVTHDLAKFARLMLKPNGYVLEQLYSPLVVHSTLLHDELKHLGKQCITKTHANHYLGFSQSQWKLFAKESPPRVKPLLYVYRVLLTGIHLMRTGRIEANLRHLNDEFRLSIIDDLIDAKISGSEALRLTNVDLEFHQSMFERLIRELEDARESSALPDKDSALPALNDFIVRARLETL